MTEPTSVYLYYDAHDVLVYVGITSRGIGRNREHNTSKSWWKHVARQTVEHFPDRASAHAREVDLISRFTPPFNVQHNPSHVQMREAYEAMLAQSLGDLDPVDLVRALGKSLPLVLFEQNDNEYVYRTQVEHSAVAARLTPTGAKQAKVIIGDGPVGHIKKVESRGPLALIHAVIRRGTSAELAEADLKVITGKPITFQLRRIRLASELRLAS